MHVLERPSGSNRLICHYHVNLWVPNTLIDLYQTGRRMEPGPAGTHEELVKFHRELPEMIKRVPQLTSRRIYLYPKGNGSVILYRQ